MGVYPSKSIKLSECVYVAGQDLCFSLVPHYEWNDDEPYSEVQWLSVPEIRTYGALMLAVDREESFSAFYPYPFSVSLVCPLVSGPIAWATEYVRPILVDALAEPDRLHHGYKYPARNSYRYATDIPLPPVAGGRVYDLREKGIDYVLAQELHDAILPSDAIVLRGLSTLIKGGMLHFHYQFFEEAINTLYISMEASYRLVLRKLRETGNQQPTAKDAATFIHDAFNDVNRLEKYFEEDYERRITSFHPENRLGVFPHPPMMADDYYFLFNDLLEVYRYLLTGYVHPMHLEKKPT